MSTICLCLIKTLLQTMNNYSDYLPKTEKKLYDFCIRQDHTVGDILNATGDSSVKNRSNLNNVIEYSTPNFDDRTLPGTRRRFTGYQILAYAVLFQCYQGKLISKDHLINVYRTLTNQVKATWGFTNIRDNQGWVDGNNFFEHSARRKEDAAKIALSIDFPLLMAWMFDEHPLLIGFKLNEQFMNWRVEFRITTSNRSPESETLIPALIIIDLKCLLMPISTKLGDGLAKIPITYGEILIDSLREEKTTSKTYKLSDSEIILIENLRNQLKRQGSMDFHLKADHQGKMKEISYIERKLQKSLSAKKIFEDSSTNKLTSFKGSNGEISHYEREVKIKF